jgi:hypothetical protein
MTTQREGHVARTLLHIQIGVLLFILAVHLFNAFVWGNWDQEGTGALGFWHVFLLVGYRFLWLYGLLMVTTVITWSFCIQPKGSQRKRGR